MIIVPITLRTTPINCLAEIDSIWKIYPIITAIIGLSEEIGVAIPAPIFLADNNKVCKLDPATSVRLEGYIETHDLTNTIIAGQYPVSSPEQQDKILQFVYMILRII